MKIAPSVLSLDYSRTKEQLEELNASKAEWMHFDVMDGHFVPNLTFGPDILKGFCRGSDLFKDVHLMVDDPDFISSIFIPAGAQMITFHYEALSDGVYGEEEHTSENTVEKIKALAEKIRKSGCKAGLSIKPKTSVSLLKPFLNDFDLFLIMSVEPGFGGQSFMMGSVDKIAELRKMLKESDSNALIEVDGGINLTTAKLCLDAGVDVLVAGSFVFKNGIAESCEALWKLQ